MSSCYASDFGVITPTGIALVEHEGDAWVRVVDGIRGKGERLRAIEPTAGGMLGR